MAVELQFTRPNNSISWGFRLTGGADLNVPITVIKIAENGIAEKVGMKVGDLLVRVGETPTSGLTHLQVHDLIKDAGNTFVAAVIRGELPPQMKEAEQTIDSQTTKDGISQSLKINIKTNVIDTTQIVVENGEEIVGKNIKINGSVVSSKEEQNVEFSINRDAKLSEETRSEMTESQIPQIKDELSMNLEKLKQAPECIKDSEVLKVITEEEIQEKEIKADKTKSENRWTTFLQKPDRPKPKIKQIEDDDPRKSPSNEKNYEEHVLLTRLLGVVQEPPYRVIIQKQKKKRDAEKAAAALRSTEISQESTPVSAEMMAETPEVTEQHEEEREEERENDEKEEQQTEQCEQQEEPMISEVEMSLEEQLAAIQKQLLALSQLPAAIQQTLEVVTQQLDKIVGPVNDPNTEENETKDESQEEILDDTEQDTDFGERTGELETLEEVSEGGFDRDSQQTEGDQEESERLLEGEFDKIEPELEMLQETPEPEDLTPEEREARRAEREKKDKKQKENPILSDLRQRRIKTGDYPLTPMTRPICLPGGRKWHAPDDAHPALNPRHQDMSDEQIADTISAQTEVLVGTTLGINFLKYQPLPKTLDHLQHSEVFRLVHDMDQPARGVGARPGKAMAEEDYYAQARKSEPEAQKKG